MTSKLSILSFLAVLTCVAICGCSRAPQTEQVPVPVDEPILVEPAPVYMASQPTAQPAAALRRPTYHQVVGTAACTDDCSGHDAGYEWAQDNDITDPDDCDGNSDSFVEGCQAYAEEVQAETENEDGEAEE